MKIIQVTKYYYPAVGFGGIVQCTHNLSKYLVKRGHEVTVYTTDALYPTSRDRIVPKVQIIDGVEVHFFHNVGRLFEMFITPDIVRAFLHSHGSCDVIHLHEYRTFQNVAFLLSGTNGSPYVLQTHGIKLPRFARLEGKGPIVGAARQAYDKMFGNRLLRGASAVIVSTNFERKLLEESGVGSERIFPIPNAVSVEDFPETWESNSFRDRMGIAGHTVVLYVGRIDKSKGLDTLVRAFYLISIRRNDVRLVIAGPDDGYLRGLTDLVRSLKLEHKVLFTGTLSHKEVMAAYSCAHMVAYPSICEGFGIVPLEAAAMGKPVVVSDDPGMDWVREHGFGLTFEYGNEYQLADCLKRLLEDDQLARLLGEQGKRCAFQHYTWDIVGSKVEELYQGMLSGTQTFSGRRNGPSDQ